MLATPVIVDSANRSGPRPINLGRDSNQILALLDVVFGPLSDSQGRRLATQQVNLSYGMPLYSRLGIATRGFVPGYVWEEEGQIIGNLSLLNTELEGRFLIANVAVHPDYRRRGIGRGLMREAMEQVRKQKGREILLQVESDNTGAIRLYHTLGFQTLGSMRRWQATSERLHQLDPDGRAPAEVRELRKQDWREAYKLDIGVVEPDLNWPVPPPADKYRSGPLRALADFLGGRRSETWAIYLRSRDGQRRQIAGLAHISSDWGRPHHLDLRLDPAWSDRLARPLLASAISRFRTARRGSIRINHPADDETVGLLLHEANFQARRTLAVMRLDLL
jgi:ribosomal protein S18 acetylase RimI-like enzyme